MNQTNHKIILSVMQDMNYKNCLTLRKNSYHTLDAWEYTDQSYNGESDKSKKLNEVDETFQMQIISFCYKLICRLNHNTKSLSIIVVFLYF